MASRHPSAIMLIPPILVISLCSGVFAWLLNSLYHVTEHWVYAQPQSWYMVLLPVVTAGLAGGGWWLLYRSGHLVSVPDSIRNNGVLRLGPAFFNALVQTFVVAFGASIGREGAPRLLSATVADEWSRRFAYDNETRMLLVAAAAGAGLSSAYNVPIAGFLYANHMLELSGWRHRWVAAVISVLATIAAFPDHRWGPRYVVDYAFATNVTSSMSYATNYLLEGFIWILTGIACLVVGRVFVMLVAKAEQTKKVGAAHNILLLAASGLVIGLLAIWIPTIRGNGVLFIQHLFDSHIPVAAFVAYLFIKPVITAMFVRSGVIGGMLTPALSTGAAIGTTICYGLSTWSGIETDIMLSATVGAAMMLGILLQAPLFASIFMLELAQAPLIIWPIVIGGALMVFWVKRFTDTKLFTSRL